MDTECLFRSSSHKGTSMKLGDNGRYFNHVFLFFTTELCWPFSLQHAYTYLPTYLPNTPKTEAFSSNLKVNSVGHITQTTQTDLDLGTRKYCSTKYIHFTGSTEFRANRSVRYSCPALPCPKSSLNPLSPLLGPKARFHHKSPMDPGRPKLVLGKICLVYHYSKRILPLLVLVGWFSDLLLLY